MRISWLIGLFAVSLHGVRTKSDDKYNRRNMTIIIAIVTFIVIALVGWCIAEAKGKFVTYNNNELEQSVLDQQYRQLEQNGYTELNIKDVIRTIATTGYSAV